MHESLSKLSINTTTTATNSGDLGIQMELVSEEEMASIEAALAAATPSLFLCNSCNSFTLSVPE